MFPSVIVRLQALIPRLRLLDPSTTVTIPTDCDLGLVWLVFECGVGDDVGFESVAVSVRLAEVGASTAWQRRDGRNEAYAIDVVAWYRDHSCGDTSVCKPPVAGVWCLFDCVLKSVMHAVADISDSVTAVTFPCSVCLSSRATGRSNRFFAFTEVR